MTHRWSAPPVIENEQAYEAAIARRIRNNSKKTAIQTNWIDQDDHAKVVAACEKAPKATFLGKMFAHFEEWGKLSPKQVEAVRKVLADKKAKAEARGANSPSRHLGEVGKRIEVKNVTVKAVVQLDAQSFGYGNLTLPNLTILVDESGNVFKVKSASFKPAKGDVLDIVGTVKKHDVYNGEQNTVLQRVKVLRHDVWVPEVPAELSLDPATLDLKGCEKVLEAVSNYRSTIYSLDGISNARKDELSNLAKNGAVAVIKRQIELENQ